MAQVMVTVAASARSDFGKLLAERHPEAVTKRTRDEVALQLPRYDLVCLLAECGALPREAVLAFVQGAVVRDWPGWDTWAASIRQGAPYVV